MGVKIGGGAAPTHQPAPPSGDTAGTKAGAAGAGPAADGTRAGSATSAAAKAGATVSPQAPQGKGAPAVGGGAGNVAALPMAPMAVEEGYEVHRPTETSKPALSAVSAEEVPRDPVKAREHKETRAQANPFRNVAKERDVAPPKLGRPLDLQRTIDPPQRSLQGLAKVEAKLGAEAAPVFNKVRQGMMLVASDGQDATPQLDRGGLGRFLSKITRKEMTREGHQAAIKSFMQMHARFLAVGQQNVQALVQAVLRESYLMQNEILFDMAEKVKFYNEKKRRMREKLNGLRQAQAQWTGLAKGDELWRHPEGIPEERLTSNGTWEPVPVTERDLELWDEQRAAYFASDLNSAGGYGISAFERTEPSLSKKQRQLLDEAREMGGDAEWLYDHKEAVASALRCANREEFDNYMFGEDGGRPLLKVLTSRDQDILHYVLMDLSPLQTLHYIATCPLEDPTKPPHFELGADGARAIGATVAGAAAGAAHVGATGGIAAAIATGPIGWLVGAAVAAVGAIVGWGIGEAAHSETHLNGFTPEQQEQFDERLAEVFGEIAESVGGEPLVSREGALELLQRLRDQHAERESEYGERPRVGDPRRVYSTEELEAYVENLEADLGQIGDDAQLANVDLQSALQRQQQTLQMLSNISKMLHDTALATVRKLGS